MNTLGMVIREIRELQDSTLRDIASQMNVSAAYMSDVELSRRYPTDIMLARIARVLGVSLDVLLAHDTRPPIQEFKAVSRSDPAMAFAIRRLLQSGKTAADIVAWLDCVPSHTRG